MKHYTGLDVSVKETSICIVDEMGKICREVKVPSHPDDLIAVLRDPAWILERVGLEAGPLSQWLFEALARAGLPVICIETRHVKAFLKAQPNKTDRNDARGIAQMMRVKSSCACQNADEPEAASPADGAQAAARKGDRH
jgi:transposase